MGFTSAGELAEKKSVRTRIGQTNAVGQSSSGGSEINPKSPVENSQSVLPRLHFAGPP